MEARQRAREILTAAPVAPADHEYLRRKALKPHALKVHDGALVVPMRDERGLCNVQFIYPDGAKRFLPGGKVSGAFHEIGEAAARVVICEGAATGYSIHEATGLPVRCAMSAGNLSAIAQLTRRESQSVEIIIAGDNDENGTGQQAAAEAARAVGARLAVPKAPADWNDIAVAAGLEAVQSGIEEAYMPESVDAVGETASPDTEEIPPAPQADEFGSWQRASMNEFSDTDLANAQRFAVRYGKNVRFTTAAGWLIWDGKRWTIDEKDVLVMGLAKETAIAIYDEIKRAPNRDELFTWAKRSQSRRNIEAMIALARSEPGILAKLTDFDADPYLLNVENGTLDLRTGALRPHLREDFRPCRQV